MESKEDILKALEIIRQHKELRRQGKVVRKSRKKSTEKSKYTLRIRAIADDVARDYEMGVKIEDIRRKYGISDNTLYKILSDKGIERRGMGNRPHITTKDLRALVKYLKGVKVKDLAIPKWRLKKIKQFFGIPKRRNDLDDVKKEKIISVLKDFLKDYKYKIVVLPIEEVEMLKRKINEILS